MKYLLMIGALLTIATSGFAQGECSKNHPIFKFDNGTAPKEVSRLGSNPEFPQLKNLSTPQQVLTAMKRTQKGRAQLNGMLKDIGFENGVNDVKVSSITATTLTSGTTGNMGDGNYNTSYTKLSQGCKAWKVTSDNGCYMYFMAKCGNAFAVNEPPAANPTACLVVPVNVTSAPKVITTGTPAEQRVTDKMVFIYYHKKGKVKAKDNSVATVNIPDSHPSRPLLLSSKEKTELIPHEYKVTVSAQDDRLKVCPDKAAEVAANINVEYSSEFTGNYPSAKSSEYRKVSKHVYKKSMRKMRRAHKLEHKVARLTHTEVNTNG